MGEALGRVVGHDRNLGNAKRLRDNHRLILENPQIAESRGLNLSQKVPDGPEIRETEIVASKKHPVDNSFSIKCSHYGTLRQPTEHPSGGHPSDRNPDIP